MSEDNQQCEFNKNGSCIFYDVIYSTIENCIEKLVKIDKLTDKDIKAIIDDLKGLLERG